MSTLSTTTQASSSGYNQSAGEDLSPQEHDAAVNASLERMKDFPDRYINIFKEVTDISKVVHPSDVERVITIAKEKGLSVHSLRVCSAKPFWIQKALHCPTETKFYTYVKQYYVVAPLREHWKIMFFTDLNEWVQVELLTKTYEKASSTFQPAIEYKNNKKQQAKEHYLLPAVSFDATYDKSKKILDCNIKWAELMTVIMLDKQTFTKYDFYFNNCQQWAERVMQGVGLPCPTAIIPEFLADSARGASKSTPEPSSSVAEPEPGPELPEQPRDNVNANAPRSSSSSSFFSFLFASCC